MGRLVTTKNNRIKGERGLGGSWMALGMFLFEQDWSEQDRR